MIYLIMGENVYEAEQELSRIVRATAINPERADVGVLDRSGLADIMRGASLFATKRLVVLRELSRENSELWSLVAEWASELSDDTTLVLVESKPDKRTKVYKSLAKIAKVIAVEPLTGRQLGQAEAWLRRLTSEYRVELSPQQLRQMIERATVPGDRPGHSVIDQMILYRAVRALEGGEVTDDAIDAVLAPATADVLFDVLAYAVRRDSAAVEQALIDLRLGQDPYQVLALIMSQWTQLVAVAYADSPAATIATELEIHPFVVQKLQPLSREFSRVELAELTQLLADLDAKSKLSQVTPWEAVERFLRGVVQRSS